MHMADSIFDRLTQRRGVEDRTSDHGVLPHELPLAGRQGTRLHQDVVGDADFADVMQPGGNLQFREG